MLGDAVLAAARPGQREDKVANEMTERDGPEKEVVKHVLAAFLIFNPEDFLNSLAGVAATRLQESYVRDALESLRSVISAGTLPYRLICSSVQQRHFDRIHTAERIRCLKDTEPGEGLNAQDDEQAFRSASQIMQEFVQSEEGTRNFRDRIVYEMNHALDSIHIRNFRRDVPRLPPSKIPAAWPRLAVVSKPSAFPSAHRGRHCIGMRSACISAH